MSSSVPIGARVVVGRRRPFSDPCFDRFIALVDGLSTESHEILIGFAERLRAVEGIPVDPLVD
ncbi:MULTISPECIES: hypothetical protein [unclassified Nocardia]|uniref:hypothetical protein n=1 Tax=unclassified Nocardia TaxID=2637762 RepID=UPI0033B790E0